MFTGFSQDACDFLFELMFHNEKPWFEENRARFDRSLRLPFQALAEETAERMRQGFPEKRFFLHVARIYRDARLPRPNGPYRDSLWFSLKEEAGMLYAPMFWFEVNKSGYGYGMGFYAATPAQMEGFRRAIDANPAAFSEIVQGVAGRGAFEMREEQYRRPKGDRGALLNPWYNCKRPGVSCLRDFDGIAQSAELPAFLTEEFSSLMPLYEFLRSACRAPEEGEAL